MSISAGARTQLQHSAPTPFAASASHDTRTYEVLSHEQAADPKTTELDNIIKLQACLFPLRRLAKARTIDLTSLNQVEATLVLLKESLHSNSPESDARSESEVTRTLLKDLAQSSTPETTSLHAIQATLTLVRQRIRPDTPESPIIDEIQETLTLLKRIPLTSTRPSASTNTVPVAARQETDTPRRSRDAASQSTMSNGTASAGSGSRRGPDADALAVEMRRHEETRRSLARTEANVQQLHDELKEANDNLEDIRADRDFFNSQLEEAKETIRELSIQVKSYATLREQLTEQALRMEELNAQLQTERAGRAVVEAGAEQRDMALSQAAKQIDALELRAQEIGGQLAEKNEELASLRSQLNEAKTDIAKRDKKLRSAATEKKRLKGTVTEAGGHLKETAVVVGETVLNLNSELERLMAAIQKMETTAEPPTEKRPRKQE